MRRLLKGIVILLGAIAVFAALTVLYVVVAWDRGVDRPSMNLIAPVSDAAIARGKHIYTYTAACWTCHATSDAPTLGEPPSGGRVFDMRGVGPGFGFYYGANITPDPETGIGQWTDGELVRAMREGLSRDNRVLFPVMNYVFFHGMSDDDALAVVAYLRSLPPVRHEVPKRSPSFAAKALFAFGVLHPSEAVTSRVEAPPRGVSAEYGKYLAWHLSGCAECHTPRDPQDGSFDFSRAMAGGRFPFPERLIETTGRNLTPDLETGLGAWTEEQFLTAMKRGARPDGTVMTPFMPWPLYAQWDETDLRAVWTYLRSLPAEAHEVPRGRLINAAATGRGAERGHALYSVYCHTCHGEQGQGTPLTGPVLIDRVKNDDPESVAETVAAGLGPKKPLMPSWRHTLSPDQIADIITYLSTSAPRASSSRQDPAPRATSRRSR